MGRVHAELGALANAAGDPQASIGYSETAAEMLAEEEFIRLIVLGNLAESYERTGDLERARTTAQTVLEAQRANGDRDGVAYMSLALASVALADGDLAESHRRLIECLTVAAEVGFVEVTAYALGLAADLAVALDELEDAAMLIGACREQLDQHGVVPHVPETARQARVVSSVEERHSGCERGDGARPGAPPRRGSRARHGPRRQGRLTAWSSGCSARWRSSTTTARRWR